MLLASDEMLLGKIFWRCMRIYLGIYTGIHDRIQAR